MPENLSKNTTFAKAVEELGKLVRIPSVSFPGFDQNYVALSAQAVQDLFNRYGFARTSIVHGEKHPAVLAAWGDNPNVPTILLYAHHDVQPPMRTALWYSDPFEPTIRQGRMFGRGAADDKAGILVHAVATMRMKLLAAEKGLPSPNIRVLIEGEEEIGSPGLAALLQAHAHELNCDAVIVADLANHRTGVPAITASLRGMTAVEIEVRSLRSPVHSGLWSGPIPDPVMGMAKLLASLVDEQGQIAVVGLCDGLQSIPADLAEAYSKLGIHQSAFRAESGMLDPVQLLVHEDQIPQALWRSPSLVVTTLEAGARATAGNVLMDAAWARVSIRLAPGMDWRNVQKCLIQHLEEHCPWGLTLKYTLDEGANAWSTSTEHPWFALMLQCLQSGYGQAPVVIGCGASIPGAPLFTQTFGDIPVLMTGLEDPSSQAHGENESLDLGDFAKAIEAQTHFLTSLVKDHAN